MRIDFDREEVWTLMSFIVNAALESAGLSDEDRAAVRRWRSEAMKPGSGEMRLLTQKINEDLAQAMKRKEKSGLRKPDWR